LSNFTKQYIFNRRGFNPLFWHIIPLLRDSKIRYILVEGGSSAAKTFTLCQALLVDGFQHDYSTMVFRRQLVDVNDSVYSTFKMAARGMDFDYYDFQQHLLKGKDDNGNIRFRGLDDEENIKGVERFNVVYFNEFNQFEEHLFDQAKLRLRGRKNQKFICDWNPVSSKLWQYENWIDLQQWEDLPLIIEGNEHSTLDAEYSFKRVNTTGDTVWIKTTYRDNYWVVGRPGGGGNIDTHTLDNFEQLRILKPNIFRIYANGERGIIRTGGEFWKQIREDIHVGKVDYTDTATIHVSCDQNVTPYVTLSLWQVVDMVINQFHELPCKSPDNNAVKSAAKLDKYLNSINYEGTIYLYGDPSGNNRSVVDEQSRSFYDKFIAELKRLKWRVVSRIKKAHPAVNLSADFINEIYENNIFGYSIKISDTCGVSIDDYLSVKEDKDGGMMKTKIKDSLTGQSYEQFGHFSDAKRYFITTILETEYNKFKSRKSNIFVT